MPFVPIHNDGTNLDSYGLAVKLNGADTRLGLDTIAAGLTISKALAERLKLVSSLSGVDVARASMMRLRPIPRTRRISRSEHWSSVTVRSLWWIRVSEWRRTAQLAWACFPHSS